MSEETAEEEPTPGAGEGPASATGRGAGPRPGAGGGSRSGAGGGSRSGAGAGAKATSRTEPRGRPEAVRRTEKTGQPGSGTRREPAGTLRANATARAQPEVKTWRGAAPPAGGTGGTLPDGPWTGGQPADGAGRLADPGSKPPWRLPLLVTGVAVPFYVFWAVVLATGGGDLAAQLAWAGFMARHPGSAYNLSWYGGTHTANYSVLAPPLMALLGVRTTSVLAGLAGTWAMAALFVRARVPHAVWPALLGALVLWCNVASGRTTFALGAAVGLLALFVLLRSPGGTTRRTVGLACALSVLTALASPVAALFLVVAGAAYLLDRQWGKAAALIAPPFLTVGVVTLLFPFHGEQPMATEKLYMPLTACAAVWLAAPRGPRGWRTVRYGAAVYGVGVVLTYSIASPIGTNVERLIGVGGPPVLLAALLTRGLEPSRLRDLVRLRAPHLVLAAAVVLNTGWVIDKTDDDLGVSNSVPSWAAHPEGVIDALDRLGADRTRVEVVPARNHREADVLAPYVTMARGWNRQLDVERGRLFYDGTFSAATYRAWLDRWAVGLVVLPAARPDSPAAAEAALLRNDLPDWLEPVWHDRGWAVYRVRDAVPLVSAPATVVRGGDADLVLRMPAAGSVTVRIAYSPWLRAPGACVERAGDWTRLTVPGGGEYRLGSAYRLPRSNGCG